MTLTLKTTILFLHKTLKLMMMYHPIKFGCKNISSSVDTEEIVRSDYMSFHCDPELEHVKPVFLHDTLAYDDASPYQVSLQKGRQLKKYHPDEHSLEILIFPVTMTHNRAIQSFHKTIQLMMMSHKNQV